MSSLDTPQNRAACSECQRRKQKCDKGWPCSQCLKRKIGDKCHFALPKSTRRDESSEKLPVTTSTSKKRQADIQDELAGSAASSSDATSVATPVFGAVGYNTAEMLASLGLKDKTSNPTDGQHWNDTKSCAPLDRAIKMLPQRQWIDSFLQTFFNNINTQFSIIYSASFIEEYRMWWGRVSNNRTVGLHWTCLLLEVCACSVQHANPSTKAAIELELGDNIDALSEKFHNAARELGSAIPIGYHHVYGCQWYLYSAYWYISQGRYPETWHVLNAAAREARELGLDRDDDFAHLPQFDREMRRRVYCILQILDWQISAGLSKATIVNWAEVNVVLPNLTMEGTNPPPMLHMSLQSQLISDLATRYPGAKDIATEAQVLDYQETIKIWSTSFPPVYALVEPDTSKDTAHPWVAFNRLYLHTMFYYLQLTVIRRYMAMGYTSALQNAELQLCEEGIQCCRENLKVATKWADHISRHGGGFHWVITSIMDTVVLLATCFLKDAENTMPKDESIYGELDKATTLLGSLAHTSPIGNLARDACVQITGMLPRPASLSDQHKRPRVEDSSAAKHGSQLPGSGQHHSFDDNPSSAQYTHPMTSQAMASSGSLLTPESDNNSARSPHTDLQATMALYSTGDMDLVPPAMTITDVTNYAIPIQSAFDDTLFDQVESQPEFPDPQLFDSLSQTWYNYWE